MTPTCSPQEMRGAAGPSTNLDRYAGMASVVGFVPIWAFIVWTGATSKRQALLKSAPARKYLFPGNPQLQICALLRATVGPPGISPKQENAGQKIVQPKPVEE